MARVKDLAAMYAESIMVINSCSFNEAMVWVNEHSVKECREYIEENW